MQGPSEGGSEEPIADLNVIPFIDICLVLLIIVLVTASFSQKLLCFDHPQAGENPPEYVEADQAVTVTVLEDGKCDVNGKTVEVEGLTDAVKALGSADGFPPFVLRASGKAKSKYMIMALGHLLQAGEVQVSFARQ